MREIVPGVLTWPWFSERFQYDFNGYYLPEHKLVIDPVEPTDDVLAHLISKGVDRIVITNRNHTRAADKVRGATGARVAIHAADADFARERNGLTADDTIAAGDAIGPLTAIDAAGKSPGELALHWPARRILFVGDACVGHPAGALGFLPAKVIDDLAGLKRSLARIADSVDFDTILVGDGTPVLTGARDALRKLLS